MCSAKQTGCMMQELTPQQNRVADVDVDIGCCCTELSLHAVQLNGLWPDGLGQHSNGAYVPHAASLLQEYQALVYEKVRRGSPLSRRICSALSQTLPSSSMVLNCSPSWRMTESTCRDPSSDFMILRVENCVAMRCCTLVQALQRWRRCTDSSERTDRGREERSFHLSRSTLYFL